MNKNFVIIFTIVFCLTIGVCTAAHTELGHYPGITLEGCGYGRLTEQMEGNCFEYHKGLETFSKIMLGREAQIGEMPWVVLIIYKFPVNGEQISTFCTGSILNEYWIITAAHCGVGNVNLSQANNAIDVYIGSRQLAPIYSGSIKPYKAIYFVANIYYHLGDLRKMHDIALIKLDRKIDELSQDHMKPVINSICLPKAGIVNTREEYAINTGYGNMWWLTHKASDLRMGWTQILVSDINNKGYEHVLIVSRLMPKGFLNGTRVCGGDFGGPLIQFVNGRAVIIGIAAALKSEVEGGCPYEEEARTIYTRVSAYTDWITYVIRSYP